MLCFWVAAYAGFAPKDRARMLKRVRRAYEEKEASSPGISLKDYLNFYQVRQISSVVDPNTWYLDPDPGFWPNLDPGPDPGLYNQFWKKKFKIILEKKNFLWNKYIFLNYKNKLP